MVQPLSGAAQDMPLDADVAAVMDGSRPKVRGILRLPVRSPPSYSAIASRQTAPSVRSTSPSAQPTAAQHSAVSVSGAQPWQTVVTRRRGDKHQTDVQQPAVLTSPAVETEAVTDESRAEAKRRRKKKAGEPPPPSLHFAELLEAQLRRAEEKRSRATDQAVGQPGTLAKSSTAAVVSPDTSTSAPANLCAVTTPPTVSRKRAKPTKLKRQIREQQLHAFIRLHILAPIVQAAVTQAVSQRPAIDSMEAAEGSVHVGIGGEYGNEDGEQREREKRERKRMLRHLKRKQKRVDKEASRERSTNQLTASDSQPAARQLLAHDDLEDEEGQKKQGENDDAVDDPKAAANDSLLPQSHPADKDEDPSCPMLPYSFTDEERAFLFQHVVVDRYHFQPPLSSLVSALCQQLFTASVDTPVAHLLLALASYQRRALSSPSPLVRARGRRMVMGLREAAKRLKQNRLLLLILPHNVETAHPTLATQLAALYFQCVSRRVDVVWSLSRRRLANCCGVKGKVAVVGVVSGEGCSELMRSVRDRAKEAREAWGLRGWDERVEAGVRERKERDEADREAARREWQEHQLEARREEKKKEKARLDQELADAQRRDKQLRQKQAERRLEQQRQAALRREDDERAEQERIAEEAEKVKRKQRQERTKAAQKGDEKGLQQAGKEGKAGEVSGGKKTWLEEAAEGKDGGLSERANGGGKQGKTKATGVTGKTKSRR